MRRNLVGEQFPTGSLRKRQQNELKLIFFARTREIQLRRERNSRSTSCGVFAWRIALKKKTSDPAPLHSV